jgi:hypothetical protein
MTDEVGLLQHASGALPNRHHGYCTDDNARALMVALTANAIGLGGPDMPELVARYLTFLSHAFNAQNGRFRNFMGYDRRFREREGSADSHGRAIWALGISVRDAPDEGQRELSERLLLRAVPATAQFLELRPIAYALVGIEAYLSRSPGDIGVRRVRDRLAGRLFERFPRSERAALEWPWPEEILTYANATLPHALLVAARALRRSDMKETALRALSWLCGVQTIDCHFVPIGSEGWYPRGGLRARFGQQPIEAEATAAACVSALRATGDPRWLEEASRCVRWFLGDNDLGRPLADIQSGGCRDGIQATRLNENQGAESTLAWLRAQLHMHGVTMEGTVACETSGTASSSLDIRRIRSSPASTFHTRRTASSTRVRRW